MRSLLHLPKLLIVLCYIVVVLISLFFDKFYLKFALPVTLLAITFNYCYKNEQINPLAIICIITIMISDYLGYSGMMSYFKEICIATSIYLSIIYVILKDYVFQIKLHWRKLISLPLVISLGLFLFLIFSISGLLINLLPESTPYIVITVIPLLMFVAITYYVYKSEAYNSGIKLLFSSCLCLLEIALNPINELFYSSFVFTIFITTSHILGTYILMDFIKETAPVFNDIPDTVKSEYF